MKLVLEAMDFLELASTNHKLHLTAMRPYICPFGQVGILLRLELFVISQAKTRFYQTFLNLYHGILLLHAFLQNQSKLEGPGVDLRPLPNPEKFLTTLQLKHVHFKLSQTYQRQMDQDL